VWSRFNGVLWFLSAGGVGFYSVNEFIVSLDCFSILCLAVGGAAKAALEQSTEQYHSIFYLKFESSEYLHCLLFHKHDG
jgi:hypothetical protein